MSLYNCFKTGGRTFISRKMKERRLSTSWISWVTKSSLADAPDFPRLMHIPVGLGSSLLRQAGKVHQRRKVNFN